MLKDSILDKKKKVYRLFIGGEWVETRETLDVCSPFSGKVVSRVFLAGKEELIKVVETAHVSWQSVSSLTPFERGKILGKTADILEQHIDELATLIVLESGKTITESIGEAQAGILRLRFGIEEAKRLSGEVLREEVPVTSGKMGIILRQPVGVLLAVSPFNYPFFNPISKIAPAVAMGNAVILKPSSDDPTVTLLLARAFEEAGLPKGVLQVVVGSGGLVGDVLVPHPFVNMISFTGSSQVGKEVARKAIFAKLHLELGGKCPAIILSDADLDLAAEECAKGAFKFSGQRCDAISRILVVSEIYKQFVRKLLSKMSKWKMGDPMDSATSVGPLINEKAVKKVEELVIDAIQKGAKVLMGGKKESGLFFEPTVLGEVTEKMRIAWEETFGPVAAIMKVGDFEEAISVANKSEYALDSSIFTKSIDLALEAGMRLQSGTVQINAAPAHGIGEFPFGGDESSGLGRQGIFVSAEEMTKTHAIIFNNSNIKDQKLK